jgi:hypothetical protein
MANDEESSSDGSVVIFINRIDTYFGRIVAQHLGCSRPLATKSDNSESARKNIQDNSVGGPDCFQIIGSYRLPVLPENPSIPVPDGPRPPPKIPAARKLFPVDSEADLTKAIDSAKIQIYHTTDEDGENELFSDTLNILSIAKTQITASKDKKTIFLVSSLMTWCNTKVKG